MATGLPKDSAAFQARSALTGVGFTTSESENVVRHPVRRRIIMALMLVGSAGLATVISSLVVSFVSATRAETFSRLGALLAGLVVIWLITRSKALDRLLTTVIQAALTRWTDLDVRDLVSLLELTGEYEVAELEVDPGDWIAGKSLAELRLSDEGVLVLAIRRASGEFMGTPGPTTVIYPYDMVILYGRDEVLSDIENRRAGPAGDAHHAQRVREQIEELAAQEETEVADGTPTDQP